VQGAPTEGWLSRRGGVFVERRSASPCTSLSSLLLEAVFLP
jgi:hypothetical protein